MGARKGPTMLIERLPDPFKTALRRAVLQLRIPLHQLLTVLRRYFRRFHRWMKSDPTRWHLLDLGSPGVDKVGIFAITLLDDPRFDGRRRLFDQYAKRFGWSYKWWPAVNGRDISPEEYPAWLESDRPRSTSSHPLTGGEMGLLMTTWHLYRSAWEEGLEYLVVFEDDAVIHSVPVVEVPEEFDIVFLNNRFKGDLSGRIRYGWGTDGYIMSRRGLGKALRIFEEPVTEPIDLLLIAYVRSLEHYGHYMTAYRNRSLSQLDCFHVGPLVTHAGHFPSSI